MPVGAPDATEPAPTSTPTVAIATRIPRLVLRIFASPDAPPGSRVGVEAQPWPAGPRIRCTEAVDQRRPIAGADGGRCRSREAQFGPRRGRRRRMGRPGRAHRGGSQERGPVRAQHPARRGLDRRPGADRPPGRLLGVAVVAEQRAPPAAAAARLPRPPARHLGFPRRHGAQRPPARAMAAVLILVARRVRGRTSVVDAFFPIVLLHLGTGRTCSGDGRCSS